MLGASRTNGPPFLNLIYSNEDREAAFDCLSVLSDCWGIACYSWADGDSSSLQPAAFEPPAFHA